ncbi:MAG: hypothetical protein QHH02_07770 [Syntrophomonadaceae bacterium]|nr:hypothetical protein [Syntrophomonadaceae bacterium]
MKYLGYILAMISIIANVGLRKLPSPYDNWAAGLLILTGLAGIASEWYKSAKLEKDIQRSALHDLLNHILCSVRALQNRRDTNTLRINIMENKNNQLVIIDQIGMSNDLDHDISFSLGQGCSGASAEINKIVVCDLTEVYDTTFELNCQKNNSKPPFGISKAHWEKTRDLKSLISVPIRHPKDPSKVIGILNLDDKISIDEAQFQEDRITGFLEDCAPLCAEYIIRLGGGK